MNFAALVLALNCWPVVPGREARSTGEIHFVSRDIANQVPDHYRLETHVFRYELERTQRIESSGIEIYKLRFPSPVNTPHEVNNTVHAEYFVPTRAMGKLPAVVVLDILDGKGVVARSEALWLATNGIPALCVTMPYYGPRRPEGTRLRLLTPDVKQSVANVRQAVLDCRRAFAWLAEQPEVDAAKLGVVGTSLGSFVGGLVAAAEPRVHTACLLLGGGGLVDSFSEHPRANFILRSLALFGVTRDDLKGMIAPVDPLTYAERLKTKRLLLIGASRDDIVPPSALTRLWEATGRPPIVWYDATHVGAARYVFEAMQEVVNHLKK